MVFILAVLSTPATGLAEFDGAPRYGSLRISPAQTASIEREEIQVTCREINSEVWCDFRFDYLLRGVESHRDPVELAFQAGHDWEPSDQILVGQILIGETLPSISASEAVSSVTLPHTLAPVISRSVQLSDVEATRVVCILRRQIHLGPAVSALTVRHLTFGERVERYDHDLGFYIVRADEQRFSNVQESAVRFELHGNRVLTDQASGALPNVVDGGFVWRSGESPPRADRNFYIQTAARSSPTLLHGGPLMAAGLSSVISQSGAAISRADQFFFRVGYEAGLGWPLIGRLELEVNGAGRVAGALMVELAAPWLMVMPIVPSLGLAVGVRCDLDQHPEGALRLQLTGQYGPVGLVATFDYRPSISDWESSLGARFSL